MLKCMLQKYFDRFLKISKIYRYISNISPLSKNIIIHIYYPINSRKKQYFLQKLRKYVQIFMIINFLNMNNFKFKQYD